MEEHVYIWPFLKYIEVFEYLLLFNFKLILLIILILKLRFRLEPRFNVGMSTKFSQDS